MNFKDIKFSIIMALAAMSALLLSCDSMRVPTVSAVNIKIDHNPILPIKVAREIAMKNGNAFFVRDFRFQHDYVFSYIADSECNYIDIIQFDRYGEYDYEQEKYRHYKQSGRISLPYYNSFSWVYDFDYQSYISNGCGQRNTWRNLIFFELKDGKVVETLIDVRKKNETTEECNYVNADPDNNDFYRQLVHDMLKFNIITEYTVKKRLHIPTFDILESDSYD